VEHGNETESEKTKLSKVAGYKQHDEETLAVPSKQFESRRKKGGAC
jgi:hypothetical protein